jgi:TonB-dependent SusC/RagA subfamily outer membrane receptor
MKNKLRGPIIFILTILLLGVVSIPGIWAQNQQGTPVNYQFNQKKLANSVMNLNSSLSKLDSPVTIKEATYRLGNLINLIASQANLTPSYSKEFVPVLKKVKMPKITVTAKKALNKALRGIDLTFRVIAGNQLIFIQKPVKAFEQVQETITGTVVSSQTNQPLIGVNILVKGTNTGATTNDKGHYRVSVPSLQDTLIFSYIGYKTKAVPIDRSTTINVALETKIVSTEELVVVGYGKKKEKNVISSVSKIESGEIMLSADMDLGNALTGKVTGVSITQQSGLPGGYTPLFFIRGVHSLSYASSRPLFVIDGVEQTEYNAMQIYPENVACVSVLKDAAATAIYGLEGANGVVLITTKHGKKGPANITFKAEYGIQQPTLLPEFVGSYRYAKLYDKAQLVADPNMDPSQLKFSA